MSSGLRRTGRRSEATPFAGGRLPQFASVRELDLDAARYLAAVEAADGARLEPTVRAAVNSFVVGCKADGIWTPIKAACILAGARTLTGALLPLVGAAPTNNGFVSGDYSRRLGLVGNGSSKWLNSNRNNNADPQNSKHLSVYVSTAATSNTTQVFIGSDTVTQEGPSLIYKNGAADSGDESIVYHLNQNAASTPAGTSGNAAFSTGLIAASRSSSTGFTGRVNGSSTTYTQTSEAPQSKNIAVFARTPDNPARYCNARLAFYSIGESLDLALLDSRVTTLANALAAALP